MTEEIKNTSGSNIEPQLYNDISDFSAAISESTGLDFDLASVVALHADFIQATDKYVLLNVKDYQHDESEEMNDNMLFLTEKRIYLYSKELPEADITEGFTDVLEKPFGKTTVFTFTIFDRIEDNYNARLEVLGENLRRMEQKFSHAEYLHIGTELERLSDRLDEFRGILIRLQERRYKFIEPQYIPFDYGVLLTEISATQGRCRRRLSSLQALRQDHEMRITDELNNRIIKLNDVVKRLTALTVIMMVPTLIASHYGMNFKFMPELNMPWFYPAVVGFEVLGITAGVFIFKKIGWL